MEDTIGITYSDNRETRGKEPYKSTSAQNSVENKYHKHTTEYLLNNIADIDRKISALADTSNQDNQLYANVSNLISDLNRAISIAEARGLGKEVIKCAIADSREVFSNSPYVNRMQTWPRGYAGDFETVEMIHSGAKNTQFEDVGSCVEYYAQSLPISQQHRNKLNYQQSLAMECLSRNENILSIGCGGAIDIYKALKYFPNYKGRLTFIDMDKDAIALVKERTAAFDCIYITRNIIRGIGGEKSNFYHLVLCGGLFDYLDDKVSTLLLKQIRKKLAGNGRVFLTNIAESNPFRVQMEYFGDWVLIERTEAELSETLKNCFGQNSSIKLERDPTGLAILATVRVVDS